MAPGRIEFVILRTGRSPPAALHHALLRRSCIRLQAGERLPGEDFHLSDYSRFQAHLSPLRGSQQITDHYPRLAKSHLGLNSDRCSTAFVQG
jgi:hypothetical protein